MQHFTTDEDGNFRVNTNLLPLLKKLGIKGGGGGFVMPPVVLPIVNIETLDEAAAVAQLTATVTGNLAAEGSTVQITVPPTETWKIETVLANSAGGASAARMDAITLLLGGTFKVGVISADVASNRTSGQLTFSRSFAQPLFLPAGDIIQMERIEVGTTNNSVNLAVVYRLA